MSNQEPPPCDHPCDVLHDMAVEVEKLRKEVEYLDNLRDLSDTMALEIENALQINADDASYEMKYALGCVGLAVQNYWDAQTETDQETPCSLD